MLRTYSSYHRSNNNYYKKPFRKTKGFYILLILIIIVVGFIYWSIKRANDNETNETQKYSDSDQAPRMAARVTFLSGKIELLGEDNKWSEIAENYEVKASESIRTNTGTKAALELPDKSIVRLNENSEIKFAELGMADIVVEQIRGAVFHRINDQSTAIYRVKTKNIEFTSLGTAFNVEAGASTANLIVTENKVKVKIYNNDEIVNMRTVEAGTRAEINPALPMDQTIRTSSVGANDLLALPWYAWNIEEDTKANYYLGLFAELTKLIITKPAQTETTTDQDKIKIKGQTDPEASIFMVGKELDNNNGSFETEVELKSGKNEIEITVQKGKNKNKKTLIITSTKEAERLTLSGQKTTDDSVALSWELKNAEGIKEFKVLLSKSASPTYPNTTYHTQAASIFKDAWTDLDNGTYYFRVCGLGDDNKCKIYSDDYIITIGNAKEIAGTIQLSSKVFASNIELNWTISQDINPSAGFRSVISDQPTPVYPGNSSHFLTSNQRNDIWKKLNPGKYYFRLCLLADNQCAKYSNESIAIIPENVAGSFSLSGSANTTQINLTWSVDGLEITKGYRVIVDENPGVVFPGKTHHLVLSNAAKTDSWTELEKNKIYYFRICQNLGSTCGVYSNEISLKIK